MICPVCKAENTQGPQCRRCRVDLSLLFTLEEQRSFLLGEAARHAANGHWEKALPQIEAVERIRSDDDSRHLRALCRLFLHDFTGAWQTYLELSTSPS